MTSSDLLTMLETRHAKDVFVAECKDGASQTRSHRRLDAWVLAKTWSPVTTIGYEIKVSRGDWLRDTKLASYLPLCHLLYVVAPKGLVKHEELPESVGLIEPVGTSGRIQIRRRASRRQIEMPTDLLLYVLMSRTKITRELQQYDATERIEHLRAWVDAKDDRRDLSYMVSQKIQTVFNEQASQVRRERLRNDELQKVRDRIVELGFDPDMPVGSWQVRARLEQFNAIVTARTLSEIRRAALLLTETAAALDKMNRDESEEEV